MSQEPCLYYRMKNVYFPGTALTGRDSVPPKIIRREWCVHPESSFPWQILGPNVPCDGDLEKCAILN